MKIFYILVTMQNKFWFILFLYLGFNGFALDAINNLSNIEEQFLTYQQANYAKDGSNNDGVIASNFLDTIPSGLVNNPNGVTTGGVEFVMANINGPAILERIWCAAVQNNNGKINFYFDGETTPRFSATFQQLFYNKTTIFDTILTRDVFESSGGNIMYASINIKNNLIVTTTAPMFCHIGFKLLPKDTIISSWSNTNDVNQTQLFKISGNYPKANQATLNYSNNTLTLQPNQKTIIFNNNGAGNIEGVELNIKDLNFDYAERFFDEGNVRNGWALFKMKINGNADSLFLVNRMNKNNLLFGINQSNVKVLVDNRLVGIWQVNNYRDYHFWEDEKFYIPKSFYQGKSSINIFIQYNSGDSWNEYRYQTICDGIITDELDIKNTQSQNSHNYLVTGLVNNLASQYASFATSRYTTPPNIKQKNNQVLDSLYISIYYDGESTPSINAPIGLFFGAGTNDASYMKALLFGNNNGTYYNYFTQPYWSNIKIELENKSSITIDSIFSKIMYNNITLDKQTHGYLKTFVKKEDKLANDSTDYNFLQIAGKGKMVAIVIQGVQDTVEYGPIAYLEGDERIYIDDAQSPFIYGTGTEDFFNCGFYFILDEVCLPLHGTSNSDEKYNRNMYRIFLNDAIYFRKNISANIEHGPVNDEQAKYNSISFYYWQNDTTYQLTDNIDVGNTTSENLHQYTVYGTNTMINKSSYFEGINDKILVHHDGRKIQDSVEFIVDIKENNNGVRLLRTFDYSLKNQAADIYVDDILVGTWLNAGANTIQQFRDDIFAIPQQFTQNKSQLKIKVVAKNNWTSLQYKVYTLLNNMIATPIKENKFSDVNVQIYPNPCQDFLLINSDKVAIKNINLYQINGSHIVNIMSNEYTTTIDMSQYAKGMYLVEIATTNNDVIVKKIIKD